MDTRLGEPARLVTTEQKRRLAGHAKNATAAPFEKMPHIAWAGIALVDGTDEVTLFCIKETDAGF